MLNNNIQQKGDLSKKLDTCIEECIQTDFIKMIAKDYIETLMNLERDVFFLKNKKEINKKNGFYSRMAKTLSGVMEISVPRDRLNKFKPQILEVIRYSKKRLDRLAFSLYVKGLTTRDIKEVMLETYSYKISAQYVSEITKLMKVYRDRWLKRKLDDFYYAIFIDATYIPIMRDGVSQKEAIYIVIGLNKEFKREILGIYSIPQESATGWLTVLEDLRNRNVERVGLFVADGLTALENSVFKIYPKSKFQKCVTHFKRNVLAKVRYNDKKEMSHDLSKLFNIGNSNDTLKDAIKRADVFVKKWSKKYPSIKGSFKKETLRYYFTYLEFPFEIRRMIYTTNWIERLNKGIKKTTKNRNGMPNEDSALTLIWATLMEYEEKVYVYPISAFHSCKVELDEMIFGGGQTQKS